MSEHKPDWIYPEGRDYKFCNNCRYSFPLLAEWCKCSWCGRCDKLVESIQGHYWSYCSMTKTKREFHFCCPDDCELEVK